MIEIGTGSGRLDSWKSIGREETLWVSRADGSGARQLTFPQESVQLPLVARWKTAGVHVQVLPGSPWRILVQRLDNGERREASEDSDNQGAPTWSPEGRLLVYGSVLCQLTHSCTVRRIDLSTGKVQMLPGSESMSSACWSSDGR